MGVMYDYFSAASDEAAASAIDLVGRPEASDGPLFDSLPTTGIDPGVQLGTLEALLTGRDYEQIVAGPRAGRALAISDGDECVIQTLTDELQDALADADDGQLASVAVSWMQTEEFRGQGDPKKLTGWLHDFAELARRARSKGQRMYCWACV